MAKKKTKRDEETQPERLGRLSMEGLGIEEALKGAMEVTPPERDPEPGDGDDRDSGDATND